MTYAKAIAAAIGSVLTVVLAALADDVLGVDEVGAIVAAAVAAVGTVAAVYATPNRPTPPPSI